MSPEQFIEKVIIGATLGFFINILPRWLQGIACIALLIGCGACLILIKPTGTTIWSSYLLGLIPIFIGVTMGRFVANYTKEEWHKRQLK